MLMDFFWGWVAAMGLMTAVWAASVWRQDASLVDRFWGIGFLWVALLWWWLAGLPGQAWIILLPVALWAVRLSLYITWRNWGHGEDGRYTDMRADLTPRAFARRSLVMIFWLQATLMAVIALPLLAGVQDTAVIWPWVIAGWLVWGVGWLYESIADAQLMRFKSQGHPPGTILDQGLWRYSRHPNYFGEILVWVGYGLIALGVGGWWALPSVVLMIVLIIRVSGVSLLDQRMQTQRPAYADYMRRTSALIPWRPSER